MPLRASRIRSHSGFQLVYRPQRPSLFPSPLPILSCPFSSPLLSFPPLSTLPCFSFSLLPNNLGPAQFQVCVNSDRSWVRLGPVCVTFLLSMALLGRTDSKQVSRWPVGDVRILTDFPSTSVFEGKFPVSIGHSATR